MWKLLQGSWRQFGLYLILLQFLLVGAARAEPYVPFMTRLVAQGQAQHLFQPGVEAQLLQLANAYRAGRGLRPLVADSKLQAAARAHALDMALHHFMGHRASTGHDFDSRMHALRPGQMVLPAMGENAAMTSRRTAALAQVLFQEWLASPPHQHTLVSRDYIRVATGVAVVNGTVYADQIFSGPEVTTNMNIAQ